MKRYGVHIERKVLGTGISYVKTVAHENPTGDYAMYEEASARIAELTAEVAKYKADAERYRWLRNSSDPDIGEPYVTVHKTDSWGNWRNTYEEGSSLDTCIDIARNALKEG